MIVHQNELEAIRSFIPDLNLKIQPYPYQIEGIAYMLKHAQIINADDMGLGKTGQTIISVELGSLFPCLVVCPASVKYNWRKEWSKWVDGRIISVVDGKEFDPKADVIIINYDMLTKYLVKLAKITFKSLVVDESHNVKNAKAQRSAAVYKLSKKIEYKFLLSGTPITNHPHELIHQLKILGIFEELFGDWKRFIYRYCNAYTTPFGLDYKGSSNEMELRKKLTERCFFRRDKSEVAKEIPNVNIQIIELRNSNRKAYQKSETSISNYLFEQGQFEAAASSLKAEALVMINTLKKLTIEAKMKGIIEWISDFLGGSDKKLVVFGINSEPLEQIAKKFKTSLVNGSVSQKDKQVIIDRFQTDPNFRLLVGNMVSLGTGVDGLQTMCSDMLVIQLPDAPYILEQAIARLHRTGQKRPVNVYKTYADVGVDYIMDSILTDKSVSIDKIIKGQESDPPTMDMSRMIMNTIKKSKWKS